MRQRESLAVLEQFKAWADKLHPKVAPSAKLYSIVQTAKVNGLEPYAYLKHLFTELPKAKTLDAIEALLNYRIDADRLKVNSG